MIDVLACPAVLLDWWALVSVVGSGIGIGVGTGVGAGVGSDELTVCGLTLVALD